MGHHRYATRISPSRISTPPEAPGTSVHLASGERSPPLLHLTDDDPPDPDPIDPYGSRMVAQSAGRRIPDGINRLGATRKSIHAPAKRLSILPKKTTLSPKPSQPEEPPVEPYGRDWEPLRP